MLNIQKSLVAISLLGSLLHADMMVDHNFNDEFNKMQGFINAVMSSDIKGKYFNISYPKMDMIEHSSSYEILFNIAGIDKNNLKLTLDDNNILTLSGEKKYKKQNKSTVVSQEIFYGEFKRKIKLPQNANPSTLKSSYKDGILKVIVNKKVVKDTNLRVIPIN